MDAELVLTEAIRLPDEDRLEIVEALIGSFQPPFDETWREVIERRSSELEVGPVAGIPWTEVKRLARESPGG